MRRLRPFSYLLRRPDARGLGPRQRADVLACSTEREVRGEKRAPLRSRAPSESHVSCQLVPMLTGEKLAGLEVRGDHVGLLSAPSLRFAGRIPVEIGSSSISRGLSPNGSRVTVGTFLWEIGENGVLDTLSTRGP